MGERQVGDEYPGERRKERSLDLSVPQVAGSAVAAVVAAKLAANLGVYGTILGAGVVSVLGTCGGSIFQHAFRRTGRHMQEVAVQAKPKVRRLPRHAGGAVPPPPGPERQEATGAHGAPGDPYTPTDPHAAGTPYGSGTLHGSGALGAAAGGPAAHPGGGYSAATLHRARRARRGGWKRPVVAVALAFGLTMGGITVYEAAAGENLSGSGSGTTVGDVFSGGGSSGSGHTPSPRTSTTPPAGSGSGRGGAETRPTTPTTAPHGGAPSTSEPTAPSTPGAGSGTDGGTGTSGGAPTQPSGPTATATPQPTPTPSASAGGGGWLSP